MRLVVAASVFAFVVACSSSSTNTSSSTTTNTCCINLRFYDCPSGCSDKCPRAESRDDECGGKSTASSSSSSGTTGATSSSTTSSAGGDVTAKKRGDDCTCDKYPDEEADVYAQCTGNVTGCNTLDLACLYERKSGDGTCVVSCSKSKVGDPTACPSGLTCLPSDRKSLTGDPWYTCN